MSRVLPILFNTEMVRAILCGFFPKTTTRRCIKGYIPKDAIWGYTMFTPKGYISCRGTFFNEYGEKFFKLPCERGDILYVRETWAFIPCIECTGSDCCDKTPSDYEDKEVESIGCYIYRSRCPEYVNPERITWRPSIHMPKKATQIWLKVTDVRVERLQDIKGKDDYNYVAEGAANKHDFIRIWDSTAKDKEYGWSANPWVWVIEFERCKKPEVENAKEVK